MNGVPKRIAKGAPNFNDPRWRSSTTVERIEATIREGKGTLMPKFAHKLAPETVAALARYVRDIGADPQQGREAQPAGGGEDDR